MRLWVELIAVLIMASGLGGLVVNRWKLKRGLGVRAIQFLCVVFVIPAMLILGLEGILTAEILGTLFGAIIGYVLAGIGKDEKDDTEKDRKTADG